MAPVVTGHHHHMESSPSLSEIRKRAKRYYNSIGRRFCPALNEEILFTAEGFNHLIFKRRRSGRGQTSQLTRIELLPLAVKLIETATSYKKVRRTTRAINIKIGKKRVREVRPIWYWIFSDRLDGHKIRVILRKIGDHGGIHFWSVMLDKRG